LNLTSWHKKRSIANRYNITSNSYDEQYAQEQITKYNATQKTLNNSPNNTILDVGCGSGLFFSHTNIKNTKIAIGIDISHNLLLKAKIHTKPLPNTHIIQADADHLPFKNNSFDILFAFTMLQNMPNPKKTLLEFKQQTKNNGKMVITGLKKVFELTTFTDLIETSGYRILEFIDDSNINCYITIAEINHTYTL